MTKQVYLLLGGVSGSMVEGYADSNGMLILKRMLDELPAVKTSVCGWDEWQSLIGPIEDSNKRGDKVVVIGYSGGGSRATWLASEIDLLIAYDPSPSWQVRPLTKNIKAAICYYNEHPMMWVPFIGELGGGKLTGIANIKTVTVSLQHLLLQDDVDLHRQTVAAVEAL